MAPLNYQSTCIFLAILQCVVVKSYNNFADRPMNYHNRPYVDGYNNAHSNRFGILMDQPDTIGTRFGVRPQPHWPQPYYNDDNNYLHEFYEDENVNQMEQRERYQNNDYEQGQNGPMENEHSGNEQYYADNYGHDKAISAAVFSHHEQKVYKVPEEYHYHEPTVVNLEGKIYPVVLHFNSYSSPLLTKHFHHPTEHHHEDTYSRDDPHTHVHTISKPVFHEIREVISPYKNVYRVIKPMKEKVQTYVHQRAKEDPMQHYHRYHGYGDDKRRRDAGQNSHADDHQ